MEMNDNGSYLRQTRWHGIMYICICNGVTQRDIRRCVEQGMGTMSDLQRELGVGAGCGQCACAAKEALQEARREQCEFGEALQPV